MIKQINEHQNVLKYLHIVDIQTTTRTCMFLSMAVYVRTTCTACLELHLIVKWMATFNILICH